MAVSGECIREPNFGNVPQSIRVFSFILSQIACSAYKVNCEKYDNLLDGHANVSIILKSPRRRVCTYPCIVST